MNASRFSVTALVLIVIIVSAIGFFFTVAVDNLSHREAVNAYYPIEGTELSVRYSTQRPSGLYTGSRAAGTLRLEGDFGYDWGAALEGDSLYLNEYNTTALGMMLCDLVRVDTATFEKEVLFRNAVLRGRCASGELVCLSGFLMPSNYPATNSLMKLYAMSSPGLAPDGGDVLYLEPATGEVLYRVRDSGTAEEEFDARYLLRTLEEVRG